MAELLPLIILHQLVIRRIFHHDLSAIFAVLSAIKMTLVQNVLWTIVKRVFVIFLTAELASLGLNVSDDSNDEVA